VVGVVGHRKTRNRLPSHSSRVMQTITSKSLTEKSAGRQMGDRRFTLSSYRGDGPAGLRGFSRWPWLEPANASSVFPWAMRSRGQCRWLELED